MNSIVIYASRTGNTRQIAEAIADELRSRGTARLLSVDEAPAGIPAGTALVVVGGPTEGHRMTEPMARFLDRLAPDALRGTAAAAFDTRLDGPRWFWGSAAAGITARLDEAGARVIALAESFYVSMKPLLEPSEAERAAVWAAALGDAVEETAVLAG